MAEQLRDFNRIGLFDSGVGGLSVLREMAKLPATSRGRKFSYVGDTARCPYGNREPAEIVRYVDEIIDFLMTKNVDSIVMACNTSAAHAFESAKRRSPVPVFDLISATAEYTASLNKKVGVMATASTVRSHIFSRLIKSHQPGLDVFELACPEFVPIIESGNINQPGTLGVVEQHVRTLLEQEVEVLILGCTHFPFLRAHLERLLDGKVQLIDPAVILREFLTAGSNYNDAPVNVSNQDEFNFYVTGNAETFSRAATSCLGALPGPVQAISVEQFSEQSLMEKITDVVIAAAESMASPAVPSIVTP
ncbi:MAG: glutamate racemase [Cyanobacteria bacterium SZAS LIN-5]|nr:glutamate racemase [Cyanobacteria bacterium SZAS LIN-5]RTL44794.1 MAG: glutamate racemase [Candidatus Melainabacteria bacterium]